MKMSGCFAGYTLKIVCVQFVIHVTHPLISIYAEAALLVIVEIKYTLIAGQTFEILLRINK
jgi:hypothetical protein